MLYGSHLNVAAMLSSARSHQFTGAFVTTQKCQSMIAPTYSREVEHHSQKCQGSHAFQGKGHPNHTAVSILNHPSRPVYGSQPSVAAMPLQIRSHQLGEGQSSHAAMPCDDRPSRPVLGHPLIAARPRPPRPILTRGHQNNAAMSFLSRLAREGSVVRRRNAIRRTPFPPVYGRVRKDPQQCHGDCTLPPVRKGHNLYAHQAATVSPFPINLWGLFTWRIYAKQSSPPPVLSHIETAEMPMTRRSI